MTAVLLATKCPHCKTTFKVANDQLKLQSGLVRCGICHQVFNGIENLASAENVTHTIKINKPVVPIEKPVDSTPIPPVKETVEKKASPAELEFDLFDEFNLASATAPAVVKVEPRLEPEKKLPQLEDEFFPSQFREDFLHTQAPEEFHAKVQALLDADLQAAHQLSGEPVIPADEYIEEIIVDQPEEVEDSQPTAPVKRLSDLRGLMSSVDTTDELNDDDDESNEDHDEGGDEEIAKLNFIRQANSRKRMTWFFSIASVMLAIVLVGQGVYQFRDLIAASFPASKDTLVSLCKLANCQVNLPAQLDALSYEADELHTLPREKTFEFSMLIRNHSSVTQAWPDIELTLKDNNKQIVLKKAFRPSDYLSGPADVLNGLQGNQEQAIKVYFVLDQLKASDYVVAMFYP